MMRNIKLIIALIYLIPCLSMAKSLQAPQDKKVNMPQLTLMLDWFINPDHGPIIIAQEKGFFAQEGVKVKIQEPADPSLPPKLVATGKVDLGIYYQPSLIEAAAEGLPLVWAGTLISHTLDGVIVLDNSSIKSLKDLKGKKIGMNSSTNNLPKLSALFKPYGFGIKDIKLVNVGWNLASALMSGRVDAIVGAYRNFELNVLKLHGYKAHMFKYEKYGIPPYDELIFIANSKKHNSKAIQRFLKAIARASQYISKHPEASWNIFKAYNPQQLDNKLNHLAWLDTVPYFAKNPAYKNIGKYERYAEFMQKYDAIKKTVNVNKIISALFPIKTTCQPMQKEK